MGAKGRSWRREFFLLKPYRFGYRSVIVLGYVLPTFKLSNCWLSKTYLCKWKYIYICICRLYLHAHFDIYIYEGCSKFFHLENVIFAKKILSPNFRELHVYLSRYMLAKIFKKNVDVWYPQIVPGVWSLVTLQSAAAALKHLRFALRCWSLLTFIGQFWHNKSTV